MSGRNPANPWSALPPSAPFVLPDDAQPVQQFNREAAPKQRFELALLPEPFFGSTSAPVVVLTLNPGDYAMHNEVWFAEQSRFDYGAAKVIYHPPNIIMGSDTAGRKVINLKW
jgi:hypothetical protein